MPDERDGNFFFFVVYNGAGKADLNKELIELKNKIGADYPISRKMKLKC